MGRYLLGSQVAVLGGAFGGDNSFGIASLCSSAEK
jgi:hypothetical protein